MCIFNANTVSAEFGKHFDVDIVILPYASVSRRVHVSYHISCFVSWLGRTGGRVSLIQVGGLSVLTLRSLSLRALSVTDAAIAALASAGCCLPNRLFTSATRAT